MFKNNVGGIDRILRIVVGLALIALTLTGTIGVWGWIGVVPLLTAALGTDVGDTLIRAVTSLAHTLEQRVVIDGIDTQAGKNVNASVWGTANSIMSLPALVCARSMARVFCSDWSISRAWSYRVLPAGVSRVG